MAQDDGNGPVYEDEESESGIFRWMSTLVVLLAISGFFGLAWYAYKNGGETVDEKDVELVKADKTPIKEAPANPGGLQIPNQDKTVYGLISGKTQAPVAEHILAAPEEPMQRGGSDTQTWIAGQDKPEGQDAVAPKTEEETEVTAKPENAISPAAPVAEALNPEKPKEQFNPAKIRAAAEEKKPAAIEAAPELAIKKPETVPTPPAPAPIPRKPAAEAKEKPESKSTAPAGTVAQLGAFKSQGEAEATWAKIAKKFSDVLRGKQHYIVRADLGSKGVFYRLQLAPFVSTKAAEEFCVDFISDGQGCFPAKGK